MNRKHFILSLSLGLALGACGDDDDDDNTDTGADVGDVGTDADTTPDVTPDVTPDATPDAEPDTESDTEPDTEPDAGDTTPPQVELIAVENPANGLSAFVEVSSDEPTTVSFSITDENEEVFFSAATEEADLHEIFAFGMIPDTAFTLTAVATDAAGNETIETAEFTTSALPDDFPPLNLVESDTDAMAAGWTFFSVFRWNPGNDSEYGYSIGVDGEGRVRWMYDNGRGVSEMEILPNGTIALNYGDDAFDFIDFSGRVLSTWHADDLSTSDESYGSDSLHHELAVLPGGNYLILDSELRNLGPYTEMQDTDDDGEPDTEVEVNYDVIADVIIEVTPEGEIVDTWNLFDYYDALAEPGPSFHSGFWNGHYAEVAPDGVKDWTHANAVTYDANDDSFIVSVRHLNSVMKISRATDEIIWDFAPDGTFAMQGDGDFVYHQHAPKFLEGDSNRLLVFDNGNNRNIDSEALDFTRAVAFDLDTSDEDPANWTATEAWSWVSPDYAPFLGNVDYFPASDSVLVTAGGIVALPEVGLGAPHNQKSARLVEVTFDDDHTVLFDLWIHDDAEEDPIGYSVYRAFRWDLETLSSLPVSFDNE